jgi:hypothetical protein
MLIRTMRSDVEDGRRIIERGFNDEEARNVRE